MLDQPHALTRIGTQLARAMIWYVVMWLHLAEPEQGRSAQITSVHTQKEQKDGWSCGYHAVLNCLAALDKERIAGDAATQDEVNEFFSKMLDESEIRQHEA